MASPDVHEDKARDRTGLTLRGARRHVRPGSFPFLLVAIAALYLLNGLAIDSGVGFLVVQGGRLGVLCAGIYVLSAHRLTLWVGVVMSVLAVTFEAGLWPVDAHVGRVLEDSIAVGFFVWILAVVLREVFRPTTPEREAVIGALCGFMIILVMFMRVHGLVEAVFPGSYQANGPLSSQRSDAALEATFQYFSTITATTVGFGDVVPVAPVARIVTGLEAIVGQLYLAVVIATLVGRVVARRE